MQRALAILYHCAEHASGVSFSELKTVAGDIAGTTLSRILSKLLDDRDLIKDVETGLYVIGPRFIQAAQHAAGALSLEAIIEPIVKRLALKLGHSAAYFHWDEDWMYVGVKYELPENFHYSEIGFRHHPIGHTFFRPIQTYLNKSHLKRLEVKHAEDIFQGIRKDGYYEQLEELRYPILRITAPVFCGPKKNISGAIGITSLVTKPKAKERQEIIEAVLSSAAEVNQLLQNRE